MATDERTQHKEKEFGHPQNSHLRPWGRGLELDRLLPSFNLMGEDLGRRGQEAEGVTSQRSTRRSTKPATRAPPTQ